jgi:hypothetical protein
MTLFQRGFVSELRAFDGEYEIIFSETFNLYENKLIISGILGFTFDLIFIKDEVNSKPHFESKSNDIKKHITVSFFNFNNPLGVGTTQKNPILEIKDEGKKIYMSIFVRSISPESSFLQVGVTFYKK